MQCASDPFVAFVDILRLAGVVRRSKLASTYTILPIALDQNPKPFDLMSQS
jgi:hypothetical protein